MTTTAFPYTELQELGHGSQGRVVLAHDDDGQFVAIKYLTPQAVADPRRTAVFRREATLLAQLTDPHVARLHKYVENAEFCAIVMEAVAGITLRALLDDTHTGTGLSPEAALLLLKGSLLGLAAAHAAGVVHRDYKPANVMVQPDGQSKLIDFGTAVLAGARSRAGTPAYMAPEQWRGEPASPSTDVYAATCVFYECVTGRRPFGDDITTLEDAHLSAPVPARELPRGLRPLLSLGMAKTPQDRPPTATAFVQTLETAAADAYGPDWEQRGRTALAAAAAALAATIPAVITAAATQAAVHAGRSLLGRALHSKAALGTAAATAGTAAIAAYLLSPPPAARADPPALTHTQAAQVLNRYLTVSNAANAHLDMTALSAVETAPELTMDASYYSFSAKNHLGPVQPTTISDPQFWIPRIPAGHPRWFVVHTGPRSRVAWTWYSSGWIAQDPGAGLTRSSANSTLLFAQQRDGAWRLTMIVDPPATGTTYPAPVLDAHGYATDITPDAPGYAYTPASLPARAAALNTPTATPNTAPVFGPQTCSNTVQNPKNGTNSVPVPDTGWTRTHTVSATGFPVYALRTRTSALVWATLTSTDRMHRINPRSRWYYGVPYTGVLKAHAYYFHSFDRTDYGLGVIEDPAKPPLGPAPKPHDLACGGTLITYHGT